MRLVRVARLAVLQRVANGATCVCFSMLSNSILCCPLRHILNRRLSSWLVLQRRGPCASKSFHIASHNIPAVTSFLFMASTWSADHPRRTCLNCSGGHSMVCDVRLATRSSKSSERLASVLLIGEGSSALNRLRVICESCAYNIPGQAEKRMTRSPSWKIRTAAYKLHFLQ